MSVYQIVYISPLRSIQQSLSYYLPVHKIQTCIHSTSSYNKNTSKIYRRLCLICIVFLGRAHIHQGHHSSVVFQLLYYILILSFTE